MSQVCEPVRVDATSACGCGCGLQVCNPGPTRTRDKGLTGSTRGCFQCKCHGPPQSASTTGRTRTAWSTRGLLNTTRGRAYKVRLQIFIFVTFPLIFRSSQGCAAVSIDTCTALARFIGYFWRQTPAWVGLPPGFRKPTTHTNENPRPWMRVRVLTGTGAGYSGKPQGSP